MNKEVKLYETRGEAMTKGRFLVVSTTRSGQEWHSFHHIGSHRSVFLKPIDEK